MRAARVNEFGPVEHIRVEEVPAPTPGTNELLVRISVAGVNFADIGMSTGAARRLPPPFTPGVEAAGTVDSLGEGVTGFALGERVVYWNALSSAFAEYAVVPAWRAVRIPAGVSDEAAVALMVQGTTAHYLATDSHAIEANHAKPGSKLGRGFRATRSAEGTRSRARSPEPNMPLAGRGSSSAIRPPVARV